MTSVRFSVFIVLLLCGCVGAALDLPTPIFSPSGKRGYSMTGTIQHTASEQNARALIDERLRAACHSDIVPLVYELSHYSNLVTQGYNYSVAVECR